MMVSSLRVDAAKRQKAGQRAMIPQSYTWSVQALKEACEKRGIECEESEAFSALRGVVVRCGKTIIMSVRASLEEQEKIFTIAHELAHLALNYLPSDPVVYLRESDAAPRLIQNKEKEQEIDVWAAHFLVRPEVYEKCVQEAEALFPPEQAAEEALARAAHRLNIPVQVVGLWLRSRDKHFAVAPRVWFARCCRQSSDEKSVPSMAATSQGLESRKDTARQVVAKLDRPRPLQRPISESPARHAARLAEIRALCALDHPEMPHE